MTQTCWITVGIKNIIYVNTICATFFFIYTIALHLSSLQETRSPSSSLDHRSIKRSKIKFLTVVGSYSFRYFFVAFYLLIFLYSNVFWCNFLFLVSGHFLCNCRDYIQLKIGTAFLDSLLHFAF